MIRRLSLIILAHLSLVGCTALTAADTATIVGTDKTLGDHVISLASGKDCSTVRRQLGLTYCKEDETELAPTVHCYPTLGSVTCYDRPHPYRNGQPGMGLEAYRAAAVGNTP